MFAALKRRFWIGYIKALAAYFMTQPAPADIQDLMEDMGWNFGQDDIVAQDTNYVPQHRTIV